MRRRQQYLFAVSTNVMSRPSTTSPASQMDEGKFPDGVCLTDFKFREWTTRRSVALSRQLALQPELTLRKYEREDAFYYVGWCRG